MKKKILSIFLCTLLLATASSVAVNVDKNNIDPFDLQ